MKQFMLNKIRLSWYFVAFFLFYFGLLYILPREQFSSGALTLFSVNSFLYGFYIAPILSVQKARIDELHRIVRGEANAIFGMALMTQNLPQGMRNTLISQFRDYIHKTIRDKRGAGQKDYEDMIGFCVRYEGAHKEDVDALLAKLVENQQNRTALRMEMNNNVYSNEWLIMTVLFTITLSFILLLDTGNVMAYHVVTALLATGLSMLLLGLVKLSTLTHKKAKQIWIPLEKLVESDFYRID